MSLPRFGVTRPVPVNILMIVLIVAGLGAGATLTREFFPESTPQSASVSLPYPGATPEEIEQSLARKVEDKLADLDEVERLSTTISEGGGGIVVEFRDAVSDVAEATREVERAVDSLIDLPEDAEEIQVTQFDPVLPVIMVSLYGDADEESMKRAIRAVRDDLRSLPEMGDIVESGVREYEIRIDLDPDLLIEHGLSLPEVSDTITRWMADVPGGTVRTNVGNVNVRLLGVDERARTIGDIIVKGESDGLALRVDDIGNVVEGYVDDWYKTRFVTRESRGPSVSLTVYKVGDQDAVTIAEMVRTYVQGRRCAEGDEHAEFEPSVGERVLAGVERLAKWSAERKGNPPPKPMRSKRQEAYELGLRAAVPLPPGTNIATSSDLARFIEGRLDLLLRNAKWGAVLVFGTLLLFLNWRTALWVGVGLLTALCGTLIFMQVLGTTLNLLTMFGLIVVLGLLVDDAIVVAENIQARHDRGEPALGAAVRGANQVAWPVVATVMTSIVAFMPLTFIRGQIGDLLGALPLVVACALLMSLLESLLILPSHMAHSLVVRDRREPGRVGRVLQRFESARDRFILDGMVPAYARVLALALKYRYIAFSIAVATLVMTVGIVAGGRMQFEFIPSSDSETVIVEIDMPIGTALSETEAIVNRVEQAAFDQEEMLTIATLLGVQANVDDTSGVTSAGVGTHLGQLFIELTPTEERKANRDSGRIIQSIRDELGVLAGVERIEFSEIQGGPSGKDITIEVSSGDDETTRAVVSEIKALLATMDGVFDVADNDTAGQREVQVQLRDGAAMLGFSSQSVARQVRGALYGLDAHVFSDMQEDIDVRVRLGEDARRNLHAIEHLWVTNDAGESVPLREIADLSEGNSYSTIRRVDRRRAISVSADTSPDVSPETVVPALAADFAALRAKYPSARIDMAGRQRQLRKAFESLPIGFMVAAALIYVILAWLFGSYIQPIIVMLAIPFAISGVVWGHMLLGEDLTFMSLIGFVALSGIVVNDSLILVQFYNTVRAQGGALVEALLSAGRQRFRPILLTTITTVLGLTPLMLERSFQAKFLIPMAISISFGLIGATVLILIVLPCIIVIVDDLRAAIHYVWHGASPDDDDSAMPSGD